MEDQNKLKMAMIVCFSVVALALVIAASVTTYNVLLERAYIAAGYEQSNLPGSHAIVWRKAK